MRTYRFSLGDTRTGCVGFCFSVSAENRRDALDKARRALETIEAVAIDLSGTEATDGRVYFNARNLKTSDIADTSERDK